MLFQNTEVFWVLIFFFKEVWEQRKGTVGLQARGIWWRSVVFLKEQHYYPTSTHNPFPSSFRLLVHSRKRAHQWQALFHLNPNLMLHASVFFFPLSIIRTSESTFAIFIWLFILWLSTFEVAVWDKACKCFNVPLSSFMNWSLLNQTLHK